MGSIKRSFLLVKESFAVLKQDKELLWFPVISGFAMLLLSLSFFAPYIYLSVNSNATNNQNSVFEYIFLFIFYILSYFVITFFNTGLVTCAAIRLNGGDPTFKEGFNNALKHSGKIFLWALFAATIGMVIRIVSEQLGIFGRIFGFFGSLAWNLVTYLIAPVLILDNLSVSESIKSSAALFKKTWGEQVVGEFSMGTVFGLLALLGLFPIGFIMVSIVSSNQDSSFFYIPLLICVGIMIFYFMILGIISSALQGIYTTALYLYATTNKIPSSFSPEVIQHAFKPKNAKSTT